MDVDIWVSGLLALFGAIVGVILSSYLSRSSKRHDQRTERIDQAIRSVAVAISAHHFATRIGHVGAPNSVTDVDIRELEQKLYLSNLERVFITLRDARRDVAVLAADGLDLGDAWRGDEEMQAEMDSLYNRLVALRNASHNRARH